MSHSSQLDLFSHVIHAYSAEVEGVLENRDLYEKVASRTGIPVEAMNAREPVGVSQQAHSLIARKIRWHQQTLKHAGILERVDEKRGVWRLTKPATKDLTKLSDGVTLVGFSTNLGIAILGSCDSVFSSIDSPITLSITSPPYPLASARKYGNVPEREYVDWICKMLEPLVKNLVRGGSICLNISNDIFMPGSPSRSMYAERLVLALHDKLGLHLMERFVWHNPCKPPGPIQWASLQRVHLNVGWEPVYWFTNDPKSVKSNNRRVLEQHTKQHLDLIKAGGEKRERVNSDGAYRVVKGAYGNATEGRIPKNVLTFPHNCASQREYKRRARAMGYPAHGAPMPLSLASFLIKFLSEPDDIVADPFAGSGTTALAAELLGRRWVSSECMAEYVIGGATRFEEFPGFNQLLVA